MILICLHTKIYFHFNLAKNKSTQSLEPSSEGSCPPCASRQRTATATNPIATTARRIAYLCCVPHTLTWTFVHDQCDDPYTGKPVCSKDEVHENKQVLHKVIWEECVALAQLRNKIPIGYNGMPKFTRKTAPSPSTIINAT